MDATMVSLVEKASWVNGVEEEEAVEETVMGCRAVQALTLTVAIWRPKQAGEDVVVQITAAIEKTVDESTVDTVRAMGRVHNGLCDRAKDLFALKESGAGEDKLQELEGITSRCVSNIFVGLSVGQVRSMRDNLAEMVFNRVTSARHRGAHKGWWGLTWTTW